MNKELTFQFSGKMARLLGRESVSSDIAAIFELVKNGYDADASLVTITFENFSVEVGKHGRIILEDDGDGMSLEDVENKWMIIGTDSKELEQFSRKGRRVIGNKGIGRFATEKLCRKVTMISKPKGDNHELKLTIDWREYEKENIIFNDIKNPFEVIERTDMENTGITLILEDLRTNWTTEKINKLKIALASLVLPARLQKVTHDPFSVKVFAEEFGSEITPEIHSLLLKNAPYRIKSYLPKGRSDTSVVIYKKGKIVRTEQIELTDFVMDNAEYWEPFGPCNVDIYFYPGKSRYEDWSEHYKKVLNINNIQAALSAIRGIKIYRDSFWVRPYGEPVNDWLNLETERVQANYKVGNSQVIGFAELSKDENPDIIDTTTRERLVENNAFQCMRQYVKSVIDVMSNYRKEENTRLKEKQVKIEHKNAIESEINYIKEFVDENETLAVTEKKEIKKSLTKVSQIFSDYEEKTEEITEDLEISERAYRNLASLGISSATTSHEMGYAIPQLNLILSNILNNLKKFPDALKLTVDDLHRAVNKINTIRYFTSFIVRFSDNLAYDNEIKHEKETINVRSNLKEILDGFSGIIQTGNLKISCNLAPERMSIFMNKADFESILLNLFSNSLKALQKGPNDWRIKITVVKDSKKFSIKFSDSGKGVKDIHRDKIFRMFFTTYKQGTGLGLTIVKEIVEEYDGKIELKPYSELENGATFVISIPVENLKK